MKKTIGFIILILIIITTLISLNNKMKKDYLENFELINKRKSNLIYSEIFVDYFFKYFECPDSIDELYDFAKGNPMHVNALKEIDDPFSNEKIQYVPLYNKVNLKKEGFLLYSNGIDGSLNNSKLKATRVYIDNINSGDFYNSEDRNPHSITMVLHDRYNIYNRLFGKKDLLLESLNCLELHKRNITQVYSIDTLLNFIKTYNVDRKGRTLGFKGILKKDLVADNGVRSVFFQTNDITIRAMLYDERNFSGEIGDSIAIVGNINGDNFSRNPIEFENCVQVKLDFNPRN